MCVCVKNIYMLYHPYPGQIINEILLDAKMKLWTACKLGDNDLLSSAIDDLLAEVKKCEELAERNKDDVNVEFNNHLVNMHDVAKLVNDVNEDGNTMLHLAALGGHLKLVWCVSLFICRSINCCTLPYIYII